MKARTLILTIAAVALIAAPAVLEAQQGPGGAGNGTCDGTGPHGNGGNRGPHGGGGHFAGPGGHGGQGLFRMLHRVADKLELTEGQRSEIEAISEGHRTATQSVREQAATARDEFRENHDPGDFDEAEYRAFFESQAQIQVELHLDGARTTTQVWNVLTTEQQEELLELLELFHDGRGGKRHGAGKRVGPQ